MVRDSLFFKGWLTRLMSPDREETSAPANSTSAVPLVACDEHGDADTPDPDGVRVHALDPSGYGVFEDRGYWLVTFGGRWFQASSLDGAYTPIDAGSVPVLLVAAVAHVCATAGPRPRPTGGWNVPVQTQA